MHSLLIEHNGWWSAFLCIHSGVLQNGASRCTSELTIYKNGEVHCWDRAYDDEGNQVI